MTAPLDEKALTEARSTFAMENSLEHAIRAYLAASPSPSEMEMGKLLWQAEEVRAELLTEHRLKAQIVGYLIETVETLSAQVLRLTEENEALRKERDISDGNRDAARANFLTMQQAADMLRKERGEWESKWVVADEGEKLANEFLAIDKARIKALEEAQAYSVKGLDMIHNGLMDPTRPRQAVGEVCAHFLDAARTALKDNAL